MRIPSLDSTETLHGIRRCLSVVRRLAEEAAKRGGTAQELASQLARLEQEHEAWAERAMGFMHLVAQYKQFPADKEKDPARRVTEEALELLGDVLQGSRPVGY